MATDANAGTEAFNRGAWHDAYEQLAAADASGSLDGDELDCLAMVAYLIGREVASFDAWERAHRAHLADGNVPRAVRCAFWLSFALMNRGEPARAGGWVDRAQRLLDDGDHDCVELGYVQHQVGLRCALGGDPAGAHAAFGRAAKAAERFHDPELATLARVGEGRSLIYLGELAEGIARLDEAMVEVSAIELSPAAVGDTYCTVIEACHELFDVERAREWTVSLSNWCDVHPDLVLYRRQCLVHRAELMLLSGEWAGATGELEAACGRPDQPGGLVLGLAWYLQGELHRLRGDHDDADGAYRQANQLGRPPQPGMVMLRLAQGQADVAHRMVRTALQAAEDPLTGAALLGPAVQVALADGDLASARGWAEELDGLAADLGVAYLRAVADRAAGAVLASGDEPSAALPRLRRAWTAWRDLRAPYEAARTRVLIATVCRALGDDESANLEVEAARLTFEELGAAADLAQLHAAGRSDGPVLAAGLSPREGEVLALVAQGLSNRAIAVELVVSEKTIASHVSHIFTKLGVPNRAAATAFAYEHGLAAGSRQ